MPDTVLIKWGTGYMNLFMPEFFPCSKLKFKKVLKLIREDWQNQDAIRETLKVHFQNRMEELETLKKNAANEYVTTKTKISERTQMIKDRKYPNGLPMSKEQVELQKQVLSDLKDQAQIAWNDFKQFDRQSKQFPELLNMLESETNG